MPVWVVSNIPADSTTFYRLALLAAIRKSARTRSHVDKGWNAALMRTPEPIQVLHGFILYQVKENGVIIRRTGSCDNNFCNATSLDYSRVFNLCVCYNPCHYSDPCSCHLDWFMSETQLDMFLNFRFSFQYLNYKKNLLLLCIRQSFVSIHRFNRKVN